MEEDNARKLINSKRGLLDGMSVYKYMGQLLMEVFIFRFESQ